jgi:hypothetical protein
VSGKQAGAVHGKVSKTVGRASGSRVRVLPLDWCSAVISKSSGPRANLALPRSSIAFVIERLADIGVGEVIVRLTAQG